MGFYHNRDSVLLIFHLQDLQAQNWHSRNVCWIELKMGEKWVLVNSILLLKRLGEGKRRAYQGGWGMTKVIQGKLDGTNSEHKAANT